MRVFKYNEVTKSNHTETAEHKSTKNFRDFEPEM